MNKKEFLLTAISDAQENIKATDIKLSIVFVIIVAPLMAVEAILNHLSVMQVSCVAMFSVLLIGLFWLVSFIVCLRVLAGFRGSDFSKLELDTTNTFFNPNLFTITKKHIFGWSSPTPTIPQRHWLSSLPSSDEEILTDLSAELYKLTLIRDIKFESTKLIFVCTACWLALGGVFWIITGQVD